MIRLTCLLSLLTALICGPAFAIDKEKLVEGLTPEQAARFDVFDDFYIRGVCGDDHLELAHDFGINTVRGYTLSTSPEGTIRTLDAAHALGIKVIASEWMPNQGDNKGRDGQTWTFDYSTNQDERLAGFMAKVEALGDHPAILMWGLGNEVHLDQEYLEYVNRMSLAIHERHPLHLTSLTMVNAKPENIEKIKAFAPDIDVIGVQSYSVGAVRGGIRNMEEHWGRPYYFSEFNGKGPWNFGKTEWGTAYDDLPADRANELAQAYEAIEAAPRCLGSTAFVWGHFGVQRPNYFSLLLSEHPAGYDAATSPGLDDAPLITPLAEVLAGRFPGASELTNHAPLVTSLEGAAGERELSVKTGSAFTVRVQAEDADSDDIEFRVWIIGKTGGSAYKAVAGPFTADAEGRAQLTAPDMAREDCLVMAYALDGKGGGSATTIPVLIRD